MLVGLRNPSLVLRTSSCYSRVLSSRDAALSLGRLLIVTMFSASTLAASKSAPCILIQPFKALTARRPLRSRLGIVAMASSAGTKLGKDTPDSTWKEVLSTDEVRLHITFEEALLIISYLPLLHIMACSLSSERSISRLSSLFFILVRDYY